MTQLATSSRAFVGALGRLRAHRHAARQVRPAPGRRLRVMRRAGCIGGLHGLHGLGGVRGVRFIALAVMLLPMLAACAPTVNSDGFAGTITFGFTVPLTGRDVQEGEYTINGYQLYANTVNAAGGILVGAKRYHVALDYYDDQSQPALAAQLYQQLITRDNVNFLLGPYSSLLTAAVVPVAERYGVPMVAAHGAADSIYSASDRFVYSIVSPASDYMRGMMALTLNEDPHLATLALLGSDELFSHEVLDGAQAYATQRGLRVVYTGYYPLNSSDVSAQLEQIKAAHPDVLLVSGHLQDSILITRQARALCLSPKAVGFTVGPATSAFRANLGAAATGILGATQWSPALRYDGTDLWGTPAAYEHAYLTAFPGSTGAPYQAAESTAALVVFQQAIQAAGTLDSVAVAKALAQVDMMTFYGRIRFDARGVNEYKPMAVVQWQSDGVSYTVYPLDVAQRGAVYPMPPCMGA